MPLQRAQNAAARLVLGLDRRSHTTAALQDLHWLPVKHRITFKIASLFFTSGVQRICPTSALSGDFVLLPPVSRAAVVRRTQFGRRAFAVCGPDIWNAHPPAIRTTDSYAQTPSSGFV